MTTLASLPREELECMADAGTQILEVYRVLRKGGSNVVAEVLRGADGFFELDHYPAGDAHDPETHSQYYYHSHRPGEHGHFHTFLREQGFPDDCQPVAQSDAPFMRERDDRLSHLIAISMDRFGYPIGLFTTNRWVAADNWYDASDVIRMLDRFRIDIAVPSWPTSIWITAMLRLFRPEIETLIRARDAAIADWQRTRPQVDVFEDRDCAITSIRNISVPTQIDRINRALGTGG